VGACNPPFLRELTCDDCRRNMDRVRELLTGRDHITGKDWCGGAIGPHHFLSSRNHFAAYRICFEFSQKKCKNNFRQHFFKIFSGKILKKYFQENVTKYFQEKHDIL
jgi:hypothetical protein